MSTIHELADWMNAMASSVGSGVLHWVTEGEIHCANVSREDDGSITLYENTRELLMN